MPFLANRFGQWAGGPQASVMGPSSGLSGNYNPMPAAAPNGGGVLTTDDDMPDAGGLIGGPSSGVSAPSAWQGKGPGLGGFGGKDTGADQPQTQPPAGGGKDTSGQPQTQPTAGGATENGGSYGLGGAGPDGGGPAPAGGMMAYDDGGVIPDDVEDDMNDGPPDQGAGAATVDPMSVVKGALSFGRKAMGLPPSFYGGDPQEQGFDDGGAVDDEGQGLIPGDQNQAAAGGQPAPDPRKALQYLTGAGALAPEQAQALEAQVDPQGMMDGSERKLKALSSAGSPQAQFGYLQSMRQKFNAFGAGARAAATGGQGKPANLAEAAVAANQAFENLPTGHSVQFAPARGGIAVHARPHGGAKPRMQPAMEDGGEIDESASAEGMIPEEPVTAAVTEPEDNGMDTEPTILTPEQFDKLVQPETFEKATERGWGDVFKDILSAVNPMGSAEAGELRTGGNVVTGRQQPAPPARPASPVEVEPPAAEGPPRDNSWEATNMGRRGDDNAAMERYTNIANRLFPSVGQTDQRNAYIAHMMEKDHEQQGKMSLQENSGKAQLEASRQQGRNLLADKNNDARLAREREHWKSQDDRAAAGRDAKTAQVQKLIEQKDRAGMLAFIGKEANSLRFANPKVTPQQIVDHISKAFNVDPNIVTQSMQQIQQSPPDQGQGAPPPSQRTTNGSNMDAAQVGQTRPYTVNGVTKQYKFGSDGMWHLAPDGQGAPQAPSRSYGLGRD